MTDFDPKRAREYPNQDPEQLDRDGEYYTRHVSAMTAEGLHSKSDIAEQLAWRDRDRDQLRATLEKCRVAMGSRPSLKDIRLARIAADAALKGGK